LTYWGLVRMGLRWQRFINKARGRVDKVISVKS
jgi:hydrophobic/amphiphilic exporter-1 (mainly G- bacteria), HAE1 family